MQIEKPERRANNGNFKICVQSGKTETGRKDRRRTVAADAGTCKKYDIAEPEHGFFVKDGEDAMCVIGMAVPDITDANPHYIDYMDEWTFDVDGEVEDCIEETKKWWKHERKRGVYYDEE